MPPRPLPRLSSLSSHLLRAQSHHAKTFDYQLPSSRIAIHPLHDRSSSQLLVVPNGQAPHHHTFSSLPSLLPTNSLLIRNSSRVIPARLHMRKRKTHGRAQLMLLNPLFMRPPEAMSAVIKGQVWEAFVGGRRVGEGDVLEVEVGEGVLEATVLKKEGQGARVEFREIGLGGLTLGEVLEDVGEVPLPPYIRREIEKGDRKAYQTVYAREEGSVAAPTAGLHVTDGVLEGLKGRDVDVENIVLHVGAGTFRQVEGGVGEHVMHEEGVGVGGAVIEKVSRQVGGGGRIVALGTTSVRTLESLYWFGVRLLCGGQKLGGEESFYVGQWEPYERMDEFGEEGLPSAQEALQAVLKWSGGRDSALLGQTQLLIVPGYPFKVVDALITNFHQPRSTLLMLVSAFHGGGPEDLFRIYNEALNQGYRFLSYGDSSIYADPGFFEETSRSSVFTLND